MRCQNCNGFASVRIEPFNLTVQCPICNGERTEPKTLREVLKELELTPELIEELLKEAEK